jgi:hypothetical protein
MSIEAKVVAIVAATACVLAVSTGVLVAQTPIKVFDERNKTMAAQSYVGMWVTADGNIRHELLPNGRYVEARGTREKAYQGRYTITGNHIDYVDDTGFTADGDFVDDVLHHGGMVFYRRK